MPFAVEAVGAKPPKGVSGRERTNHVPAHFGSLAGMFQSGPRPGFVLLGLGSSLQSRFQFFQSGLVGLQKQIRSGFAPLIRVYFFPDPGVI